MCPREAQTEMLPFQMTQMKILKKYINSFQGQRSESNFTKIWSLVGSNRTYMLPRLCQFLINSFWDFAQTDRQTDRTKHNNSFASMPGMQTNSKNTKMVVWKMKLKQSVKPCNKFLKLKAHIQNIIKTKYLKKRHQNISLYFVWF